MNKEKLIDDLANSMLNYIQSQDPEEPLDTEAQEQARRDIAHAVEMVEIAIPFLVQKFMEIYSGRETAQEDSNVVSLPSAAKA